MCSTCFLYIINSIILEIMDDEYDIISTDEGDNGQTVED
jgi:hypothetical protein